MSVNITNEEREEISEKLRSMCAYRCEYKEQFYDLLVETIMDEWDDYSFGEVADRLADMVEPEYEENFKWKPITETEPQAKTPVICKGVRGYPYVGIRRINIATKKMLDDFYVPVAYGGRNQYKKPVMWCPIPELEE